MQADLAVVGAGTAGAALSAFAAEAGLKVVCLERRPRLEAGARWVNGVPSICFERARLARPEGDELRGDGHAFHLVAGRGPRRIVLRGHGVLEVDMRLLVRRLQDLAERAGARILDGTRVLGFDRERLATTAGEVRARWFVDASGLAGARLLDQPRVDKHDICSAAQEVRRVNDLGAARGFFERHEVVPGDLLCFTGIAGGYSIINVRLEGDTVSLLTGSIPGDGYPSGNELIRQFTSEQTWIGEAVFGGSRAIPLRRPLDRIADERVALLGDAACQVFSAHGSGIGAGLVAARMLADALSRRGSLLAYAWEWQRKCGGTLAAYDVFRRFSQALSSDDIDRMMASGLLDERGARAGLRQELPTPDRTLVKSLLRGVRSERNLARRLAPVLAKTAAALAVYARYPEDPARLPAWSRRAGWLFGD